MNRAELEFARAHPDPDAGDAFLERMLRGPGRISEARFTETLIAGARLYYGWRVLHILAVRKANGTYRTPVSGDGQGYPDLHMLRASTGHQVAAELKVGRNKTEADQDAWLDAFEACGVPAFVWRPEELDQIKQVLRHGTDQ